MEKKILQNKNRFIKIILSGFIILVFIAYSFYAFYFSVLNEFEFDYVRSLSLSGFANIEEMQKNGIEANWTRKKATKTIRIPSDIIIIPVFCLKPDIKENPVYTDIYIEDTLIEKIVLKDKNIINVRCNVAELGYKMGDIVNINFYVDRLWLPTEGQIERTGIGEVGIAVGFIKYEK